MSTKKNRIALTAGVLLAFVALMGGLFVSQQMPGHKKLDVTAFHGTVLQDPRQIDSFSLTGTHNKVFNNESLQGKWTMIFFGFTQCGYLCPTTMAELAKTYRTLEEKGVKPLPEVVMVSIDPDRDSLTKLSNYVTSFNPHFRGARGDEASIKKMTHELGVAYVKVTSPGAVTTDNYDIQHSGAVMLFNPHGQLVAFFTSPHQADLLAQDYEKLVK